MSSSLRHSPTFFKPVINLNKDWLSIHFKFSLILATTLSSSTFTLIIIICNAVVKIMRKFFIRPGTMCINSRAMLRNVVLIYRYVKIMKQTTFSAVYTQIRPVVS